MLPQLAGIACIVCFLNTASALGLTVPVVSGCVDELAQTIQQKIAVASGIVPAELIQEQFALYVNRCILVADLCSQPPPPVVGPTDEKNKVQLPWQDITVVCLVIPLGLLTAVVFMMWIRHRLSCSRRHTLWGTVKAPGTGPQSTLVISDVENSTGLWEVLDESVMDVCIALHHSCVRQHITTCIGVEAQLEGDSFTVAFHNANDAVKFCLAVQEAMLHMDWPQPLLECESCAPIYVSHIPSSNQVPTICHSSSLHQDPATIAITTSAAGHESHTHNHGAPRRKSKRQQVALYPPSTWHPAAMEQNTPDTTAQMHRETIPTAPDTSGHDRILSTKEAPCSPSQLGQQESTQTQTEVQDNGRMVAQTHLPTSPMTMAPPGAPAPVPPPLPPGEGLASSGTATRVPIAVPHMPPSPGCLGLPEICVPNQTCQGGITNAGLCIPTPETTNKSSPMLASSDTCSSADSQDCAARGWSSSEQPAVRPATSLAALPMEATREQSFQHMIGMSVFARQSASLTRPGPANCGSGSHSLEGAEVAAGAGSFTMPTLVYQSMAINHTSNTSQKTIQESGPLAPSRLVSSMSGKRIAQPRRQNSVVWADMIDPQPSMTAAAVAAASADPGGMREPPFVAGGVRTLNTPSLRIPSLTTTFMPAPMSENSSQTRLNLHLGSTQSDMLNPAPSWVPTPLLSSKLSEATQEGVAQNSNSTLANQPLADTEDCSPGRKAVPSFTSSTHGRYSAVAYPPSSLLCDPGNTPKPHSCSNDVFQNPLPHIRTQGDGSQAVTAGGTTDSITPLWLQPRSHPPLTCSVLGRSPSGLRSISLVERFKSLTAPLMSMLGTSGKGNLSTSAQMTNPSSPRTPPGKNPLHRQNSDKITDKGPDAPALSGLRMATTGVLQQGQGDDVAAVGNQVLPTLTVLNTLQNCSFVVGPDDPGAQLVFRGLRVRMGCHSGIGNLDYQMNKATNQPYYTGASHMQCKYLCDAGCGGMLILSESSHSQLNPDILQYKAMALHMGDHTIARSLGSVSMHQIISRTMLSRLALFSPLRSLSVHSLGVLDAPAGFVTVAFMNVVGEASLMAWNPDIAGQALDMFQSIVGALLHKFGGYLVEGANGFVLASFSRPVSAVRWALHCNSDLKHADWPEELLGHELGEELATCVADPSTGAVAESVLLRGLRIKVGLDCGRLHGEVACMTGRMCYRGRSMNRAARISAAAGTGQVLVSSSVHAACVGLAAANRWTATSMGMHQFKGLQDPVEVFDLQAHCHSLYSSRTSKSLLTELNINQTYRCPTDDQMRAEPGWSISKTSSAATAYGMSRHSSRPSRHSQLGKRPPSAHDGYSTNSMADISGPASNPHVSSGASHLSHRTSYKDMQSTLISLPSTADDGLSPRMDRRSLMVKPSGRSGTTENSSLNGNINNCQHVMVGTFCGSLANNHRRASRVTSTQDHLLASHSRSTLQGLTEQFLEDPLDKDRLSKEPYPVWCMNVINTALPVTTRRESTQSSNALQWIGARNAQGRPLSSPEWLPSHASGSGVHPPHINQDGFSFEKISDIPAGHKASTCIEQCVIGGTGAGGVGASLTVPSIHRQQRTSLTSMPIASSHHNIQMARASMPASMNLNANTLSHLNPNSPRTSHAGMPISTRSTPSTTPSAALPHPDSVQHGLLIEPHPDWVDPYCEPPTSSAHTELPLASMKTLLPTPLAVGVSYRHADSQSSLAFPATAWDGQRLTACGPLNHARRSLEVTRLSIQCHTTTAATTSQLPDFDITSWQATQWAPQGIPPNKSQTHAAHLQTTFATEAVSAASTAADCHRPSSVVVTQQPRKASWTPRDCAQQGMGNLLVMMGDSTDDDDFVDSDGNALGVDQDKSKGRGNASDDGMHRPTASSSSATHPQPVNRLASAGSKLRNASAMSISALTCMAAMLSPTSSRRQSVVSAVVNGATLIPSTSTTEYSEAGAGPFCSHSGWDAAGQGMALSSLRESYAGTHSSRRASAVPAGGFILGVDMTNDQQE